MTDQKTVRKVREALDRAKNRKQEIRQKIRELRAEMDREDVMILSCLAVLDDMGRTDREESR